MAFDLLLAYIFVASILQGSNGASLPIPSDFFKDIDSLSVAVGHDHACVLEVQQGGDVGGKATCWGDNSYGKIDAPTDIIFVQLASAMFFTCGITLEQTVQCWGRGASAAFTSSDMDMGADGTALFSPPGLYSQITASKHCACGVLTDGKIHCWGASNLRDQFYDATNAPLVSESADGQVDIASKRSYRYVQVSCGINHCCALDTNADVTCWGNGGGSLAMVPPHDVTMTGSSSSDADAEEDFFDFQEEGEAAVPSLNEGEGVRLSPIPFSQISVGDGISCGIRYSDSNKVVEPEDEAEDFSFDEEEEGELKEFTILSRPPNHDTASITGINTKAAHKYAVDEQNLGAGQEGDLICWGNIEKHGFTSRITTGPFKQVAVGVSGVCVLHADDDKMQCFGTAKDISAEYLTNNPEQTWDQVTVKAFTVCGVSMDSHLHCWGGPVMSEKARTVVVEDDSKRVPGPPGSRGLVSGLKKVLLDVESLEVA